MSGSSGATSPLETGKPFHCCCSITETNYNIDGTPDVEMFVSIANVPLCVLAIVGNALVLISISKTASLHSPSNVLLAGLAFSDFSVGLIAQPIFIANTLAKIQRLPKAFCTTSVLVIVVGAMLCGVSLLTLTAIALDRFLALHLHLRYKEIVTIKRAFAFLGVVWLGCIVNGLSYFWSPALLHAGSLLFIFTSLVAVAVSYCRIYQVVRRHSIQIQATQVGSHERGNPQNILTHKKTLINMVIIYLVFIACYLPFLAVRANIMITGPTVENHSALEVAFLVMSMNSTLNPLIYCWRFADIREAVRETLRLLKTRRTSS